MSKSIVMEKINLEGLQVEENHKLGNEFYISPNLSVKTFKNSNWIEVILIKKMK